jgi:hypothetical protein
MAGVGFPLGPRVCSLLNIVKAGFGVSTTSYLMGTRESFSRIKRLGLQTDNSPPPSAEVDVEVKLRPTISRPVCLGVGLPARAHDQIFLFCLTIAGFLLWAALSDKRTGL